MTKDQALIALADLQKEALNYEFYKNKKHADKMAEIMSVATQRVWKAKPNKLKDGSLVYWVKQWEG